MNLNPSLPTYTPPATNLVDCLRYWSQERARQPAFHFLDEKDEVTQITYSELDRKARAIAAKLMTMGFKGERALLFYPPGLDFIAAFFGCLYAGATAVPAFPPRRNRNMARVDAISGDAQAAAVLTVQDIVERSASVLDDDAAHLNEIPWLATDRVSLDFADSWLPFDLVIDTLAVLQYTSGSTGRPKGVMLTHANLMHNCSIITHGFEADQQSVGLSWLPTYHDMGLVGGILNPLFIGRPNVFMSPMSFLQKPIRWLRNISRFNVTISGGPNFAYALCNEKISDTDCEGLDLRSWKVAFNGAEPIRAETLAKFVEKFKPYGFRAEALYPCYGMAESTLIISGAEYENPPTLRTFDASDLESNFVKPVATSDDSSRQLVSSGRILPDQQVLIVDPETRMQSPINRVGEIWVRSGSVAQGYWNNEEQTERTFQGQLANRDQDNGRFLRTGDLGFFYQDQLFVTGRSKDLIIINGRNLYPHDIEAIVERAHEAVRVGGGVAFSIDAEDSEQLVIAQELIREYRKYDTEEISAAIRTAVFEALDVSPHSIGLLRMGKLPRTSSGKVQRRACREEFLSAQLDMLAHWRPGEETTVGRTGPDNLPSNAIASEGRSLPSIELWMVQRIAKQLKISPSKIDVNKTFAYFGLDSVTLIGISGDLEKWLGCSVSPQLLFNYPTISELSEYLATSSLTEQVKKSTAKSLSLKHAKPTEMSTAAPLVETKQEKSAAEILANLDDLSEAETVEMLKKLLEEKTRQEIATHGLSYGQRALWFIYQLDRTSSAYNIMYATQVRADFDRKAFCQAFQTILDRNEILRTTYATLEGSPVQQVHPFQEFELHVIDARNWNQDELDAEIQTLANVPFDLQQGPVLRVKLLERSGDHHVMLFVVHHIALDFWAFDLLFDELEMFYREATTGEKPKLTTDKATYHDFVDWQAQAIHGREGERLWEYWHQELGGKLPILDLPTDHPRPNLQSFRGRSYPFQLSNKLTQRLIALSKSEGVTLFATFLAAFQVLLYRYSSQPDILVGCPTAGRNRSEFNDVLGYFVNPIVVRSKISAEESFTSFLQQVRASLVGGITNQDYPFPMLVERLQIARDASRSPIFQVVVGWDTPRRLNLSKTSGKNSIGQPFADGSLGLEPFAMGQQGSAFDLMLNFLRQDDSVSAALQYNLDLFDESTIAGMVGHYQTLLESIADDPKCLLADLPLLGTAERHLILEDWNDTDAKYPCESCLHEMFESQASQTPDAIAVECNGERLTYQELNKKANQVAHHLADLGIGADVLVGVYLNRSLEMLVGLLGILKAGGAYVPLSPGTPRERLMSMLGQCPAPVVLTQRKLTGDLPASVGQIVCLDGDWPTIAKENNRNPNRSAEPSNLAYVIFTSGSTGQPKGVQIEHRAVANFLTSMQREPGIRFDDVLLAVTTFTFDISVLELFLPLTVGAKVVVVCPGIAADGVQLARAIGQTSATIMQATPSTWRLLIEAGWTGDRRLKALCGGEAMSPDLAESLLSRSGTLWNLYGPTETTIWSTVERVEVSSDPMPIGRPIANTQVYILDNCLQPVPRGVKGNLYIGGDGLARGYLAQSKLTAETFVDNPFRQEEKRARLYQTGDLARYRADGKIEFLGREDFQVKVHGFRIELGEIETHLIAHPDIRRAIVTACECSSQIDDRQLVAYFTFLDDAPNTSDLREFLKRNLPDYMVPSAFVPLDEFPLNPAGKIDRNALPAPDSTRPDLRAAYAAPRNDTEKQLAEIWARLLGLDKVGIHDNFFELGGASMQSLEIAALAGEVGIEMLPALMFQHPTIAGLTTSVSLQTAPSINDEVKVACHQLPPGVPQPQSPLALEVKPRKETEPETKKINIVIESIGVYLPPKSVATRDVVAGCKNKIWFPLEDMTGIKSRRVSAENEFTSDIACHAVAECLDNSQYNPDQIDLVICCHIGRDEQPKSAAIEPGTAMYLKRRFRFPNAIAFDITNACGGMFAGISIAESYLNSGAASRAIIVSAEHISPVMTTAQHEISGFIDPRIAGLTLGDAGAAIILETASGNDVGFQELEMYSLSKYSSMCIGRPTEYAHGGPILIVPDPIKHTSIAIENSVAHSKLVLDRSPWEPEEIQWVIMHQTSERSLLDGARAINKAFQRKICTKENTINNLSERGNTASTSHFVAVWDNILNGNILSGNNVVFGITGSGQTIGTGLYTFDDLPDRIRERKALGKPVKKSCRVDAIPFPASNCSEQRIRASSVGVLALENNVPLETIPMVKQAVENCLQKSEYDRTEIDLVLFVGVYCTDFISEPALATMIAGELKINDKVKPTDKQRTLAFDVINGSMGFLTASNIAAQMIRSGKIRTALVIASEVENNRGDYPDEIFGLKETASAIILDRGYRSRVGFGEFVFKYLPEYLDARTVTGKYTQGRPIVHLEQDSTIAGLYSSIIPDAVSELLKREGLSMKEINLVLPPQFSSEFLDELGRALDIPRKRFVDLTGDGKDWFTSSLPYSLHEIETANLAKPGDIGLVINVGSGLQVGCATYHF